MKTKNNQKNKNNKNWQTKKLGGVCDIYQPKTIAKKELKVEGRYFVFGANGIIGKYDKYNHENSELLLTCRGATCGSINISKSKSWINGNAMVVRPVNKNILDKVFLKYFLENINLDKVITGSAQPQITRQNLAPVKISFPKSLDEQKRIVKILDEVFAGIDEVRENAQKNLENAKEVFESYLNDVFEKGGDGWEEKKLGELFQNKPPKKEAREKLNENDLVSLVPMKDLGILQKEFRKNIDKKMGKVIKGYVYFAEGDVLLAKITPSFENGKLGIAKGLTNGVGFGSSEFIVFRSRGEVLEEYLFYFLSQGYLRKELKPLMTGTSGHRRVPMDILNEYILKYPKLIIKQKQAIKKLDELSEETKKLEEIYQKKIDDLDELKKSVLKKAFDGEL